MNIKHETVNVNGINKVYIYVEVTDEYEFGEEFLKPDENKSFLNKLKKYVTQEVKFEKDDMAVLVINGVLIGAISLGVLTTNAHENKLIEKASLRNKTQNEVALDYKNKEEKERAKELEVQKANIELEETKTNVAEAVHTNVTTPRAATPAPAPVHTANPVVTGQTIRLNTNGNVVTMNLEDYVIGVVASEMPVTFNTEALKAQAVAARTFAMKKTAAGVTLQNSTAHQVYRSETQLRQMWGASYTANYNKIKSAVNSTHGLVLKHNGVYIDALYHSMSNSRTEMPKYVWGSSLPYLQSVSSNWDTKVQGFESSTNITYATMSSRLGQTINQNTEIKVLSETVSGRVQSIKIGDRTYSGTQIRSLLGLRSTDFRFTKIDGGVTVTTRGFGHGVGMSQHGANEAAKEGYTYERILKHYYTGVSIVKL